MNVTIIDNTPKRLEKLKIYLEQREISIIDSYEVSDNLAKNNSKLFLIHKSNDNIASFLKNVQSESIIIFYSGARMALNIEGMNYTDNMFNLPEVFNIGDESQALYRIEQIVEILKKNNNSVNTNVELKKLLGFDEGEETLTNDIFNAIYEQKGEDAIQEAISKRDKYIEEKGK